MAKFYETSIISENRSKTPEGFLICKGVPIASDGELLYTAREVPEVEAVDGIVKVSRTIDELTKPQTMASYEGKSLVVYHPPEFVKPSNWKAVTMGIVQNVRRGTGVDENKLVADILIADAAAIEMVESGSIREVSCGYNVDYHQISPGKAIQKNILGNHVALVNKGRCGAECAIKDHKTTDNMPNEKTLLKSFLSIFQKTVDQMPDEPSAEQKPVEQTQMNFDQKLSSLEVKVDALIANSSKEQKTADASSANVFAIPDLDTIARAEILSPGVAKDGDVKKNALSLFYATKDGRSVMDSLLNGKPFSTSEVNDGLFVAASEIVKIQRSTKVNDAATQNHTQSKAVDAFSHEAVIAKNNAFWKNNK